MASAGRAIPGIIGLTYHFEDCHALSLSPALRSHDAALTSSCHREKCRIGGVVNDVAISNFDSTPLIA